MMELRRFTHEDRVEIAQRICNLILEKYGDNVLAVWICGSTSKRLDRPYSDLEMIAVVRDGVEIQAKYYLHRGLVINFEYSQESDFLKAARTLTWNWPIEADQFRHRIVLFNRDDWIRKLDDAVKENDKSDPSGALYHLAMDLTEEMTVLRNAHLAGDTEQVMNRGRSFAGLAAQLILILNRTYVLTTSWFWKQANECRWKPRDFEKLVRISAGFTPIIHRTDCGLHGATLRRAHGNG